MAEEVNQAPKKALNIVLIMQILFAVVNFSILGGGSYLVYISTMAFESPEINEAQLEAQKALESKDQLKINSPLIYTMDKFTVNLGGGDNVKDPKRTLQFEVSLEMLNKEGFEEVINNDNRARARDRILRILGSKSFYEIETIQGKLFLKDQITNEINSILDKGIVKDVYFTQFVVQ